MLHDPRYAMRILRRNPPLAVVAILALSLGTGANAAIFQLVDALRLRSLPVEKPHELVSIGIDRHGTGRVGRGYGGRSIFTEPLWKEIRSQQQAFSSLFAWGNGVWDLSGGGEAVLANGFYVSGGFFAALGVRAQIGRLFTEQDDQKGCGSSGVVLSHGFWQARLGGQPGVIGPEITLHRRALLGATGLVLLLTCLNLANLMLARSTARGREVAVRLAIGASRRRVVRQMLSESVLLAGLGAGGGLLLARWMSQALVMFLNARGGGIFVDLTPDWRVFAFMATVSVCTCVLFGLSPALKVTRRDLANAMQPGGRSSTEGHEALALRRGLVVVQVALSMVLVVGALLFGRSLKNLGAVDLGFDPGVAVVAVDLSSTGIRPEARTQTFAAIVARLQEVPGVRHAAEALIVPLDGSDWNGRIVTGGAVQDGDAHFDVVDGNYFRALGTPLLAGRTFDGRDRPDAAKSAIVNETFARRYFQNADPIGKTFQMELPPGSPQPTYHIVGLVRDAKFLEVREERTSAALRFSAKESSATFLPIAYLAVSQDSAPPPDLRIVLRSDVPPASLTHALTRAITEVAPAAAVSYDAVRNYIDRLLVTERLMAWLSGFFGVLAMLVAAIGLYGVMSYLVTRRRVEIGVRMALGAEPRTIIRMMFAECSVLLASGIAIGVVLAAVTLRYAAALLYGLSAMDATSFALAISGLGLASALATWVPALRASRLAPTVALRE